jgi:molybdopterin-containing oxidoreductase family iron-sulfur binding subunit
MSHDAMPGHDGIDWDEIRRRLAERQGPDYWRSLDEVADTPEFRELLHREFPEGATEWTDPVGRREFLKLMGASLALAGLTACRSQPSDKIVPYARAPEEVIPGKPLFFATAVTLGGCAVGLLVESHQGRPTKIEGNPLHPGSLGATDALTQASILGLYDPDRSQVVLRTGTPSTWNGFVAGLAKQLESGAQPQGGGLRILTETVVSPTLGAQLAAVLAKFPAARWHQFEPVSRDAVRAGARLAFGEAVNTIHRVDAAEVIVSLGSDFLTTGPGAVRYAREFASRRHAETPPAGMNRLYAIESTPTLTGGMADHRLVARQDELESVARGLAVRLGIDVGGHPWRPTPEQAKWVDALAHDLTAHRGASLVAAGDEQSPALHLLAHAMNRALGNHGRTVVFTDPIEAAPLDQGESLGQLVADMQAGQVETLLILGGNPVYTAPADVPFAEALNTVPFRAHLALYEDETSTLCHWHLPEAHYLEGWSDGRAYDGTVSIQQPLIAPLYGGRTAHEVVSALVGEPRSGYDIVREYWKTQRRPGDFEVFWRTALHDGLIADSALPVKTPTWKGDIAAAPSVAAQGLDLVFRPDPAVWDGRFANNGWLQELPKPLTKLTWDNAALISPAAAERLGVQNGEVVELTYAARRLKAPAWILPGQADGTVTLHLGYGRTRAGRAGSGLGTNAYALRTAAAPWGGSGLTLKKTGERSRLAGTQGHQTMQGRNLVRMATTEEFRKHPDFARDPGDHEGGHQPSFYPAHKYEGYAWGMAIDLNACTGCNACVMACQSENNSPVVGKAEVLAGREMHWIRVDRYYKGGVEAPETVHQPVLCMQCENAPCEPVCPVGATVHSSEGLNDMVYNRCVGTRYCSNNCPYKVRHFNFLQYADDRTPSLALVRNPNVTVRSRGVMEKCTYCVQRINEARIQAKTHDRDIQDGDVVTACQAVCPSQAIIFGDINDPKSRVSQRKAHPLNYGLLAELNTRPRTTYLARLRNPNPALEQG